LIVLKSNIYTLKIFDFFLFTEVKIIKNRLSTTIGRNRLESLMLLSCEKNISLNLKEALDRMDKYSQLPERALLFK
jgi:hypothetical protein